MRFFFDESGDFAVPKAGERRAATVAGVIVPDQVAPVLERKYRDFVSTLEPSERLNGEPKGNRLCYKHRKAFAEMLGRFAMRIALTPFTLDLTDLTPEQAAPNAKIAESIREWIPKMKHDAPKDGLEHLARQVENLSVNQAHRLYCLANCFREAIAAAVAFFSTGENEQSWETLSFEIDRAHPKPGNREEQAFTKIIGGWLWAWTEAWPIPLMREIHTPDLLVMRKYSHGPDANPPKTEGATPDREPGEPLVAAGQVQAYPRTAADQTCRTSNRSSTPIPRFTAAIRCSWVPGCRSVRCSTTSRGATVSTCSSTTFRA